MNRFIRLFAPAAEISASCSRVRSFTVCVGGGIFAADVRTRPDPIDAQLARVEGAIIYPSEIVTASLEIISDIFHTGSISAFPISPMFA